MWLRCPTLLVVCIGVYSVHPTLAAHVQYFDGIFDDNEWETIVTSTGAGGGGMAQQVASTDGNPAAYREVSTFLNDTIGTGMAASVGLFSIKPAAIYDPSIDGPIHVIDYREDSRLLLGGGQGQATTLALRQGGALFAALDDRDFTPEIEWTRKSILGLREADFRTLASGSTQPDFSSTGGPIEFGFLRANSAPVDCCVGGSRTAGIDNWRVNINPPVPGPEIRALADVTYTPFGFPPMPLRNVEEEVLPVIPGGPHSPTDMVDADETLMEGTGLRQESTAMAKASLAGGLSATAAALVPIEFGLPGQDPAHDSSMGKAEASYIRKFAVSGPQPLPADLVVQLLIIADGELNLQAAQDADPEPDRVSARVSLDVNGYLPIGGRQTFLNLYEAEANLRSVFGSTVLTFDSGSDDWKDAWSNTGELDDNYRELFDVVLPLDGANEFAFEMILTAEADASLRARGWRASADFGNTASFSVVSATPGVTITEIVPEPNGLAIVALGSLFLLLPTRPRNNSV